MPTIEADQVDVPRTVNLVRPDALVKGPERLADVQQRARLVIKEVHAALAEEAALSGFLVRRSPPKRQIVPLSNHDLRKVRREIATEVLNLCLNSLPAVHA